MVPINLRTVFPVLSVIFVLGVVPADSRRASAEDFRLENRVFAGAAKKPVAQTTTIFHDQAVYDYMVEPEEVIVFEKGLGRFVLLDMGRKIRTELTTNEVLELIRRLRVLVGSQDDPYLQFLAEPKFDEQFDATAGELTMSSRWMTYRIVLAGAETAAIARQYRGFSDWYARLNWLLEPRSRPPFARLLVNKAIAAREATAGTVHLTVTLKKGLSAKRLSSRSEHQLVCQLAASDLDRVSRTRRLMTVFKPVSFQQYRKVEDR